jgi:hypothetical protein
LALALGFVAPSNAIFVGWLMISTMLIFSQSVITTKQASQIRKLSQELAILKAETAKLIAGDARGAGGSTDEK